ncbi:MAG: hydroxymethylglutaryl-CoA lyase [Bdellovibrionales bacterium CG12_big_fil_rev_8_21_14_0_65_38_15]|nr:MAG: hydroxymethylglutaryl-CoA lyase [Bdellovibrionales bacterium CG22_combo_CG10-13_8_21_14_all_38_13]PIQ55349.1 MAG: hydroxymethylglutaryl-CoA lyase [Bdellovibrionales bacterium CG12_big_fil_rev_8_21_14_0_65_38_15]PIR28959.1 MAG: hydroxymethylglutaryl-CoA lyase [Bdellovibrionales bacterium CG11_big_fil_rev_8_21_14_0_20_38_13]
MSVRIVEVGPRDGLQNEKTILDTNSKMQFIEMLIEAGFSTIEATSFVRSEKIPQMSDAKELIEGLKAKSINFDMLPCLVPNLKGFEIANDLGIKEIAVFTATSEEFNKKNINATIDESLERIRLVCLEAQKQKVKVRGYISTVFGCPYEGDTSLDTLKLVLDKLFSFGCYEVSLGDTIGIGHPEQVKKIYQFLKATTDMSKIAWHFHDTRGMALANIYSAYQEGARTFDSSAGGLGGCPYAKGASGNVASEDVVQMFDLMGISTGIDLSKLVKASTFILSKLGRSSASKAYQAKIAENS